MKKQSIYFLVIIILLVQTSCQQNNEEEDFFNNQITLLENNPRLYLSKIDSTQVTNLNNSKEATHFLLVSLANYYVNNYYPPKEVLQKSIHIFTKKKLIQQQLESLLFLAKTFLLHLLYYLSLPMFLFVGEEPQFGKLVFFFY
jgi:endonuclease IV